jgi:hypothetical protein
VSIYAPQGSTAGVKQRVSLDTTNEPRCHWVQTQRQSLGKSKPAGLVKPFLRKAEQDKVEPGTGMEGNCKWHETPADAVWHGPTTVVRCSGCASFSTSERGVGGSQAIGREGYWALLDVVDEPCCLGQMPLGASDTHREAGIDEAWHWPRESAINSRSNGRGRSEGQPAATLTAGAEERRKLGMGRHGQ